MIIHVFSYTTYTISTHNSLGTICIVHIHTAVCLIRRADQDQPIRTNAKMAVADIFGHFPRMFHFFLKAIYIHVVIANSLHFCKFHLTPHMLSCILLYVDQTDDHLGRFH